MIFSYSNCLENFFFIFSISNNKYPLTWPWRTLSTAFRMSYGVTSVRPLSPLNTVTFVTYIYVKPMRINISLINPKITPFQQRGSIPKCPYHSAKQCIKLCKDCNVYICTTCSSFGEHVKHKKEDILKAMAEKKEFIRKDLQELEELIYLRYQEVATNIPVQRTYVNKHSQKLTTALDKQRSPTYRNRQHYPGNEVRNWWYGLPAHSSYR